MFLNATSVKSVASVSTRCFCYMIPESALNTKKNTLAGRVCPPKMMEDFKLSLVGNGFHIGIIALLLGHGLYQHGLVEQAPSPVDITFAFLRKHHPTLVSAYSERCHAWYGKGFTAPNTLSGKLVLEQHLVTVGNDVESSSLATTLAHPIA